jgi:hypothetical protein
MQLDRDTMKSIVTDNQTLVEALMAEDPHEPWPPAAERDGSLALSCWRPELRRPAHARTTLRPSTPTELADWYRRVGAGY